MADKDIILEVRDLKKYFKSPTGTLHAVDGVNFSIRRGETLGLVGESGCGKSTIGRLILGLHQSTSGEILFNGQDICKMNKKQLHDLRKDLQIIFQDPFSSLNPRMSIGEIIGEPLRIHAKAQSRAELDKEVSRLMDVVGLSARLFNALMKAGINVRLIDQGSSELNIIVGVDNLDFENAVRAIYRAFVVKEGRW